MGRARLLAECLPSLALTLLKQPDKQEEASPVLGKDKWEPSLPGAAVELGQEGRARRRPEGPRTAPNGAHPQQKPAGWQAVWDAVGRGLGRGEPLAGFPRRAGSAVRTQDRADMCAGSQSARGATRGPREVNFGKGQLKPGLPGSLRHF